MIGLAFVVPRDCPAASLVDLAGPVEEGEYPGAEGAAAPVAASAAATRQPVVAPPRRLPETSGPAAGLVRTRKVSLSKENQRTTSSVVS